MLRAPIIPKSKSPDETPFSSTASAAPMVDSLRARVGAMKNGNSIMLPVCGRDVKFMLETVPAGKVESTTCVWSGNERVQDFLTEDALDDLIPSFLTGGQQNPAFGRQADDLIEVADGSRRRMTAIVTSSDYRILVGDLDDEQMHALCKLGNDYRPTSAFERGRRYALRLESDFHNNLSALAEAENISRKVISRCMNTAKLPQDVIALFSHPGELSARAGEQLHKLFIGKEALLLKKTSELAEKRKSGIIFEAEEIVEELTGSLRRAPAPGTSGASFTTREFGPGASAQYIGNKVIFTLDRTKVPLELIEQLEQIMDKRK